MTNLIDDLMAFARIDKMQLERAPIDVSALARDIVADLQQLEPARAVEMHIQPGISCFADRGLLRVALANVIGNAWKYSSRVERARIEIVADTIDGQPVLVVRDNGAGFDMAHAAKLFGTFERLHRQDEFPGTGIGLATVARAISRQGGRVWASSVPDEGATFWFTLPGG